MVLKELIFNMFLLLGGCGGLERTDFLQLLLLGRVWWSCKNCFFHSFYYWAGCGGLEITAFLTVSTLGGCGGLERTDF